MKVVIIGCGRGGEGRAGAHSIGYAHAEAYLAHGGFTIDGACDLNKENLERFCHQYNVKQGSGDLARLLSDVKPEIVSICTYAGSHRAILEQCIAAGVRGIWCEKPLTLTLDDGRAMVDLADRANVKVVVNHYRRYLHLFAEAKRRIDQGAIGKPVLFSSSIGGWDQMEWGTHWLDLMRFWANDQPVTWVSGQVRCSGKKQGYGHLMEEHSINYFSFEDGTRGMLDGGAAFNGSSAIRAAGTDGILDAMWDGRLILVNADGRQEIVVHSDIHEPHPGTEKNHVPLLNDWVAWMKGGAEPHVSIAHAMKSSELYLTCYESAAIGDRIDMPWSGQTSFPLDRIAARQSDFSLSNK